MGRARRTEVRKDGRWAFGRSVGRSDAFGRMVERQDGREDGRTIQTDVFGVVGGRTHERADAQTNGQSDRRAWQTVGGTCALVDGGAGGWAVGWSWSVNGSYGRVCGKDGRSEERTAEDPRSGQNENGYSVLRCSQQIRLTMSRRLRNPQSTFLSHTLTQNNCAFSIDLLFISDTSITKTPTLLPWQERAVNSS